MKSKLRCLVLTLVAVAALGSASAQDMRRSDSVEAEIRKLDRAEAEGLLNRDVAALEKIWAEDFTVNNPLNRITRGRSEVVALIRKGMIGYSSFAREIEAILPHGDVVIVMGSETATPAGQAADAGMTHRRFTHVWMRRNGEWRLTARHANVVCPD